jgi:hypothetical protein
MPAAQAPAAPAPAAGGGQPAAAPNWLSMISRMLFMYFLMSYFFKGKAPTTDPGTGKPLPPHACIYRGGELLDLKVYITETEQFDRFSPNARDFLVWNDKLILSGDDSNARYKDIVITPSENVQNNGSLWAHIYFLPSSKSLPPITTSHMLTKYLPKPKLVTRMNLVSGDTEEVSVPSTSTELISYWKPNMTINLVTDFPSFSRNGIPPQFLPYMKFDAEETNYFPVLMLNEFWLMREHLSPINDTVHALNLSMEYSPLSMFKWQMYVQMEQSFQMQMSMGAVESETEDFKRMLLDTNPYLLGLTAVVSLLHMIFDFLAFKNDISFWKNNKSMEGLSVRTIFLNTFCQLIIFLYLMDNETSWLVLISSGIGLLIECWKIKKAVILKTSWNGWIPSISYEDRASYTQSKTKEYDAYAMKYLSYVLYPLVIGYSTYSLVYETHKSWYSWILASLTGTVYTFGFIMMTPQLFINYKLKSVAHLPWRTFMYKALNTFIDDLFAFIIKMPTLHRLSCFRDDLIFFIYLYQRWIYPVDKKRMNEFGQGGENADAAGAGPVTGAAGPSDGPAEAASKPKTE